MLAAEQVVFFAHAAVNYLLGRPSEPLFATSALLRDAHLLLHLSLLVLIIINHGRVEPHSLDHPVCPLIAVLVVQLLDKLE